LHDAHMSLIDKTNLYLFPTMHVWTNGTNFYTCVLT
jgi:hypothetical protein